MRELDAEFPEFGFARHHGYGTKMHLGSVVMEELIKFAKENETIKNISLGVKASNKNAILMYEKFGFEKVGIHRNNFNINGIFDDEILMDLYI